MPTTPVEYTSLSRALAAWGRYDNHPQAEQALYRLLDALRPVLGEFAGAYIGWSDRYVAVRLSDLDAKPVAVYANARFLDIAPPAIRSLEKHLAIPVDEYLASRGLLVESTMNFGETYLRYSVPGKRVTSREGADPFRWVSANQGRPRIVHANPECGHFKHGDEVVWPLRPATASEQATFRHCSDCERWLSQNA